MFYMIIFTSGIVGSLFGNRKFDKLPEHQLYLWFQKIIQKNIWSTKENVFSFYGLFTLLRFSFLWDKTC